jgi:hypothetical protein
MYFKKVDSLFSQRISFWFRQLAIFLTAWFFVKLTVVIVLNTFPFFSQLADILLRPLHEYGGEKLQGTKNKRCFG